MFMFDQVASEIWYSALPRGGWGALGVFEMACGVLLVVPAAVNWMPALTPLAAAALALETLALAGLYGRYSLQLTAAKVFRLDRSDGAARGRPGRNGRSSCELVAPPFSHRS